MEEHKIEKPPVLEKEVLSPDHPLLKKFQAALKEHLLSQINRMKEEIFEYEAETKMKNAQREELGVQTYEAQQLVCKQQKTLENLVSQIQTVTAAKEKVEEELEEQKKQYQEINDKFFQEEKCNRELQREIESVNLLITQMSQWENKIESHISVNKRIAEKSRKDMLQQAQEKRQQDVLIYKLMTEIWKLETELETLNLQIKVKESEMDELEQSIAVGTTNIEALQTEYRCLMHSWNSVVVAIANRDKGLECLNEEVSKLKEQFKSLISETGQTKKLIKKELMENERYTMIKNRIEFDIRNCTALTDEEIMKKTSIEKNMHDLQVIMDQTEQDIEKVSAEKHQKELILSYVNREYEKGFNKKHEIEEKIMKCLEAQMANDKAATNLTKLLSKIKAKKRDVELLLTEADNKRSFLTSQIQTQKFTNDENNRMLLDIQNQHHELEKEADFLQDEVERYRLLFRKKERQAEVLNSELEKFTDKIDDIIVSPQELRTLELEKHIEETQDIIKKLQTFWLREQKNLLSVSNERQQQIHDINMLKKQTLVLEQKNIKINNDIEAYKKYDEKVMHNIKNLQNKSTILCETVFKKRNQKVNLDRTNILLQSEYDTKLRDAELSVLEVEAEIAEIEEDKVNLSKDLIEINREALEWDKKYQLAREAMGTMREERCKGGEINNMKLEIHRMEVIYGQMKKAQEKLMKDLEHCISRRDCIFTTAEARLKKCNEDKTRINYSRKLDNQRNKLKQIENDIKHMKNEYQELERQKKSILMSIGDAEKEAKSLKDYAVSLEDELEQTKTNRQFNFELLVSHQKKLAIYDNVSKGRTPYTIYRKENQLVSEYNKQKDRSNKIGRVVDNLLMDFPNRIHELNRINNTLKIATLAVYNLNEK